MEPGDRGSGCGRGSQRAKAQVDRSRSRSQDLRGRSHGRGRGSRSDSREATNEIATRCGKCDIAIDPTESDRYIQVGPSIEPSSVLLRVCEVCGLVSDIEGCWKLVSRNRSEDRYIIAALREIYVSLRLRVDADFGERREGFLSIEELRASFAEL